MIKTKQELLNHFSDINEMYNNPFMYQTLSNMIDELLEQQPCEDCISREDAINVAIDAVDEWDGGCNTNRATIICKAIKKLPSVTPSYNSVKSELDHVIDEIIIRIEQTRDKDKLCEYPYNRCIKIIREVLGDD